LYRDKGAHEDLVLEQGAREGLFRDKGAHEDLL
jgi:hypothetical protein